MKNTLIINSIKFLFIILFIYTGIVKLWNHEAFYSQLTQSPFLKTFAISLAWTIPIIELMVVIMLFNRRWELPGLLTSFILMTMFTGYLVLLTQFTYYIPCSCGGFLETLPPNIHISLNATLAVIAFLGILLHKKVKKENQSRIQLIPNN